MRPREGEIIHEQMILHLMYNARVIQTLTIDTSSHMSKLV